MDINIFEDQNRDLLPIINEAWNMLDSADNVSLSSWYDAISYLLANISKRVQPEVSRENGDPLDKMVNEIPWEEKINTFQINPHAASVDDISRMATELSDLKFATEQARSAVEPEVMLRPIETAQLKNLVTTGSYLANIAFNLKQKETLPEDDRKLLDLWQKDWDKKRSECKTTLDKIFGAA